MNKYKENFLNLITFLNSYALLFLVTINLKDKDQKRKIVSFSVKDRFLGLQYEKRGIREIGNNRWIEERLGKQRIIWWWIKSSLD